jgi:branched-chain amino acid transport system substrate-binding protein
MKKILIAILSISLFFTACSNKQDKKEEAKKQVVTIGALLPLTGKFAAYGNYMKQGLEIAYDDAVKNGTIDPKYVKLAIEDVKINPKLAITAYNKLKSTTNLVAIIPVTSACTLAIKSLSNKDKIVMINTTAISAKIEDSDDYSFSVLSDAKLISKYLVKFANKLGKKKAAIVYRDDASGVSIRDEFTKQFEKDGGKIVFAEANKPSSFEFKNTISKLKSIDADMVLVASFGTETAKYLNQAKELNYSNQVMTYETFYSQKALDEAKGNAEGIIFPIPEFDVNDKGGSVEELKSKIKSKYGSDKIVFYTASMYDGLGLVFDAIKHDNYSAEKIRMYIKSLKSYKGITGNMRFRDDGGIDTKLIETTVKNGKFVKL